MYKNNQNAAGFIIKRFTAVINSIQKEAGVLVAVTHFHHYLIFGPRQEPTQLALPTGLHSKGNLLALPEYIRVG